MPSHRFTCFTVLFLILGYSAVTLALDSTNVHNFFNTELTATNLQSSNLQSVVAVVVSADGSVVYEGSVGSQALNGAPVSASSTYFPLGNISATFASSVIVDKANAGFYRITDDVRAFVRGTSLTSLLVHVVVLTPLCRDNILECNRVPRRWRTCLLHAAAECVPQQHSDAAAASVARCGAGW